MVIASPVQVYAFRAVYVFVSQTEGKELPTLTEDLMGSLGEAESAALWDRRQTGGGGVQSRGRGEGNGGVEAHDPFPLWFGNRGN
jgi:hypothetical protein